MDPTSELSAITIIFIGIILIVVGAWPGVISQITILSADLRFDKIPGIGRLGLVIVGIVIAGRGFGFFSVSEQTNVNAITGDPVVVVITAAPAATTETVVQIPTSTPVPVRTETPVPLPTNTPVTSIVE